MRIRFADVAALAIIIAAVVGWYAGGLALLAKSRATQEPEQAVTGLKPERWYAMRVTPDSSGGYTVIVRDLGTTLSRALVPDGVTP